MVILSCVLWSYCHIMSYGLMSYGPTVLYPMAILLSCYGPTVVCPTVVQSCVPRPTVLCPTVFMSYSLVLRPAVLGLLSFSLQST